VLFSSGRKGAAKPKADAKKPAGRAAAKPAAKAAAKKPVAKAAAKKPAAKAARPQVSTSKSSDWSLEFGVNPKSRGLQPRTISRPKPPAVKVRASDPNFNKTKGKGGIFPWVVSEEGSYSKPLNLSSIDFTSDDADKLIGWGAMPNSVKNLYNPKGRKGLFGGCITPAKRF